MNNDNYNIIIQPGTSTILEKVQKSNLSIKDEIKEISESLIDKRYINKQPSAKVISHVVKRNR